MTFDKGRVPVPVRGMSFPSGPMEGPPVKPRPRFDHPMRNGPVGNSPSTKRAWEAESLVFGRSRAEKSPIRITLTGGEVIEGFVVAWGCYSVAVRVAGSSDDTLVFKHSISLIRYPRIETPKSGT